MKRAISLVCSALMLVGLWMMRTNARPNPPTSFHVGFWLLVLLAILLPIWVFFQTRQNGENRRGR